MEDVFETKSVMPTSESESNRDNYGNEFKSSFGCTSSDVSHSLSNSTEVSKYSKNKLTGESTQENKAKLSKISSVLDPYCKSNILDESADFVDCEPVNKLKNGKGEFLSQNGKREFLSCEICSQDITHLDVYNQVIHVNHCIDKQIPSTLNPETQVPETENIFILECPLCFKHFSTPELRSNHIKKCGKSKGLSTQCILKALELQERHALERISLGLPAKPIKPVKSYKNPSTKRPLVEPRNKAQSDIQLAKALSLSLASSVKQNEEESYENITSVNLKPPTAHQHPGKKPKKIVSPPLLVLRTEDERNRLLLEKVATIVAPQSTWENISFEKKEQDLSELPPLWQLCGRTSEKCDYYVEQLLDWIQPSDIEVGANLCHLSQIAGHEIVTQLPCEYTFSNQEEQESSPKPSLATESSPLIECLRSLVASPWMSDVDIQTVCGTIIPAHRLLLAARCPSLKQNLEFCSESGRVSLKWENVTFDAALQFLNFIYTGNIEVEENMRSDLLYLAKMYEVADLYTLLCTKEGTNVSPVMESSEEVSENTGNKDSLLLHPPPSTQALELENNTHFETHDTNVDLEIVYNCINSSMKPSQPYINEPFSPVRPRNCQLSFTFNCKDAESFTSSPNKCTIANCALPHHNSATSPVIFDGNESENDEHNSSDNESIELPVCSQKSFLKQSSISQKDLDLYSTESNNSEDSIKFLQSSFSAYNNFHKTPQKENNFNSSSLEFPKLSPLVKKSPLAVSDVLQKSAGNSFRLDRHTPGFLSGVSVNLDSHISLHRNSCSERNSLTNPNCKIKTSDNINDNIWAHSLISDEMDELSHTINRSNLLPSPAKYKCTQQASYTERTASPEVLTWDSKSKVGISGHQAINILKSNLRTVESDETVSSNSYLKERDSTNVPSASECNGINVASPEVICFSSDEENIAAQGNGKYEKFHHANKLNDEAVFSIQDFKTSYEPVDDPRYECYEHFESGILSPQKQKAAESYSPRNSKFTKDNCATKSGDFEYHEEPYSKECLEPSISAPGKSKSFDLLTEKSSSEGACVEADSFVYETKQSAEDNCSFSEQAELVSAVGSSVKEIRKDKNCRNTATPSSKMWPDFQVSDSPITPLPDYKSMMTPEIKQALQKIGVKALPRKKAIAILSHVYNETHPLVNDEINVQSHSPEKASKVIKSKKRRVLENDLIPAKRRQKDTISPEAIEPMQNSDDSSSENPEWQGCVPEISFSQFTQESPTKTSKDDMELIKQYIESNEEVYSNILTYTPLNLVAFHRELKDNGIKMSIPKLMDFLDEQCITFTCPRKEEYRKKQTDRSQRFRKNMIAKLSQQTI